MRATTTRGNFGIKLFYPKIRGHALTLKSGSEHEYPEFRELLNEAEIFSKIG
jgi:hypothetical protein